MVKENARIRINLNSREIEIEGSETFVVDSLPKMDSYLQELRETLSAATAYAKTETGAKRPVNSGFDHYLDRLNSNKRSDKYMVAAYYAQKNNPKEYFKTREATGLLKNRDITLTNPSQYIKNFIKVGRMEEIEPRKYKLTQKGLDYVEGVLGN